MTTDPGFQRTGSTDAPDKEYDMKKSMKRTAIAGVAVLVAGASIAGGASVTAAAIDNPASPLPSDATVVVQQVAQDADGNWFSCEQELGADSGVIVTGAAAAADAAAGPVGQGIQITVSAGDAPVGGDVVPADGMVEVGASGTISGIAVVGDSGAAGDAGSIPSVEATGTAIALPAPDEIRPGTTDECNALQGK